MIDKVKEIRSSKDVTQAKLAHRIALSIGFIGNVENPKDIAKYNLNHLDPISKELAVEFNDFFPEKAI